MVIDVHVAYLFASLAVVFGVSYSINTILNRKIAALRDKQINEQVDREEEALIS